MPRRPDITRTAFRDHYENRHAPLAIGKFPFRKYARNHVVESLPDPIGFDCLSEFWVDDVAEVLRIMSGEIGDLMREDERRFTDQPRIGPSVAEETHIFGPPRTVEDGIARKEALLLRPAGNIAKEAFVEAAIAWGRQLGTVGDLMRIAFDALTPFEGRFSAGYGGVLYGWPADDGGALWSATAPAGIEIAGRIRLEAIETRLDPANP
jgi:uncharacterized protein (TIGR02118 family)